MFERLLAEHPEASNVVRRTCSSWRGRAPSLGQFDAAREAFQGVITRYPDSTAAASARWEVAWLEYRAGRFRESALAFRQLSTTVGSARLAGLYWAGRSLDQLGEKAPALALYREVLTRGPQGYYGILAARRVPGKTPARWPFPSSSPRIRSASSDRTSGTSGRRRSARSASTGSPSWSWRRSGAMR